MRNALKKCGRWALAGVALVIAILLSAVFVARSDWFRERIRLAIVSQIETATGGKAELGAFRFDWSTLTAQVDRLVVHGAEPAGQAPLLSVDRLTVVLRIVSLLGRDVDLARIAATAPQSHLIVYPDGHTNVPQPKIAHPGKSLPETILDLKIRQFDLSNGSFLLELPGRAPRSEPWDAHGENLAVNADYESARSRYRGRISLGRLRVRQWDLGIQADAALERNRVTIENARVATAKSSVSIPHAAIDNLAAPVVTADYDAALETGEFDRVLKGLVKSRGSVRFAAAADFRIAGSVESPTLTYQRYRAANIAGSLIVQPDLIDFPSFHAAVLGGSVSGKLQIRDLAAWNLSGRVDRLRASEAVLLAGAQKPPYDGIISGPFQAEGTLSRLRTTAKLAVSPAPAGDPVSGELALSYDSAVHRADLGHSWFQLPHSRVELDGTLGQRLNVALESTSAPELLAPLGDAAADFRDLQFDSLNFTGAVTGPLDDPSVAGRAAARNLHHAGQILDSITADITASRTGISSTRAEIAWQGSRLRASGSVSLANWRVTPQSLVNGNLDIANADFARLATLAGNPQIQLTGTLSGNARVSGAASDPLILADLTLTKGELAHQPYDSITARVQTAANNSQTASGLLISGSKRINYSVRLDRAGPLPEGNLEFNVTTNTAPLAEVKLVHDLEPDIRGFGKLHADGILRISRDASRALRFDIATINADASANSLEIGGRIIGDTRFTAQSHNDAVALRFDSNAANAAIQGIGTLHLGGDYPMEATVGFRDADLRSIAALALKPEESASLNFEGTLRGEVSLRGPALHPERIEGDLNVEQLVLRPASGSQFARALPGFSLTNDGPIRARVSTALLRIESAKIKAPQTNLSLSGTAAFQAGTPGVLDFHARGDVNLAVARSFSDDLTASGVLSLDAAIGGQWTAPDLRGRAVMRNGEFRYGDFSNGLSNVTGEIQFTGSRATVESLTAETGGGRLSATGFAALSGSSLNFRIEAQARGVRVRYPEGVSSLSDAALIFSGTPERSQVSGNITVSRVAITPRADAASILAASAEPLKTASAGNSFLSNMNLDVQISTAADVALQTSLTQSIEADASLRLRGTVTSPAVLGRINVTQGELIFFGNKYTINQGSISFFNATRIEPVLNFDLETKARGVDVVLTVSGPMNKLNMSYRSDPPLQFSEIVALLATGRTPSDPTLALSSTSQPQSFEQLGASALIGQAIANPVAGRLQRFFGVSRLKIDPQLTGLTASPQARLTVEQQVTPELLFTYVTDVSSTSTQLIRVEWAFNPRWSAILVRDENGYVALDFAWKKGFR
jgi:translocation and assembly module TamB